MRIAITPGEPAGIGPDIVVEAAQMAWPAELVAIGSATLLRERAKKLTLPLEVHEFDPHKPPARHAPGHLTVLNVPTTAPVEPGKLNVANGQYVLDTLRKAVSGCQKGTFSAMVTGPVHKGIINQAGVAFTGHTEFLQKLTGVERVVMMLATENLRVALVTTHVPLAQVPRLITRERLNQVLRVLTHDLTEKFGLVRPRIVVAGFNPHAGEGGHLGREEVDIIGPVLDAWRSKGWLIEGPLPADTLFTPKYLNHADAVLCMYHDQGLPVLKYEGFGRATNITLGLPIIRTSVDHGTALDLAGSGHADWGSLKVAIETAIEMAERRQGILHHGR
ncbi:4-hydroxythreonine-4-phosphate dehydrogenase PdxA [Hahella sp. SMD15-11]|uniref:4-hydroxythreonine-4-phosphate dehydrogenase n=1 Tax=Thermohahella caldifontis TaxID=3142973 RepID=A0AB39UUN3_9GAMM